MVVGFNDGHAYSSCHDGLTHVQGRQLISCKHCPTVSISRQTLDRPQHQDQNRKSTSTTPTSTARYKES